MSEKLFTRFKARGNLFCIFNVLLKKLHEKSCSQWIITSSWNGRREKDTETEQASFKTGLKLWVFPWNNEVSVCELDAGDSVWLSNPVASDTLRQSLHPTVKPHVLQQYLKRLSHKYNFKNWVKLCKSSRTLVNWGDFVLWFKMRRFFLQVTFSQQQLRKQKNIFLICAHFSLLFCTTKHF